MASAGSEAKVVCTTFSLGELLVAGEPDLSHAAAAELALEDVAAGDLAPGHELRRRGCARRQRSGAGRRRRRQRIELRGGEAIEPRVQLEVDRADDRLEVLHARLELLALVAERLELALGGRRRSGVERARFVAEVAHDPDDEDGHHERDHPLAHQNSPRAVRVIAT
jgi:hypothetical protein